MLEYLLSNDEELEDYCNTHAFAASVMYELPYYAEVEHIEELLFTHIRDDDVALSRARKMLMEYLSWMIVRKAIIQQDSYINIAQQYGYSKRYIDRAKRMFIAATRYSGISHIWASYADYIMMRLCNILMDYCLYPMSLCYDEEKANNWSSILWVAVNGYDWFIEDEDLDDLFIPIVPVAMKATCVRSTWSLHESSGLTRDIFDNDVSEIVSALHLTIDRDGWQGVSVEINGEDDVFERLSYSIHQFVVDYVLELMLVKIPDVTRPAFKSALKFCDAILDVSFMDAGKPSRYQNVKLDADVLWNEALS